MIYILIYLLAIVLANMSVFWFGPASTIVNAFLFIGLDLSLRDKLHEKWIGKNLWLKMFLLIIAGSIITFAINSGAGKIALASVIAFSAAALIDALMYSALFKRSFLVKSNGSNLASALADSILFPTIAFGILMPWVILGQFAAKIFGGFLWSLILNKFREQKVVEAIVTEK